MVQHFCLPRGKTTQTPRLLPPLQHLETLLADKFTKFIRSQKAQQTGYDMFRVASTDDRHGQQIRYRHGVAGANLVRWRVFSGGLHAQHGQCRVSMPKGCCLLLFLCFVAQNIFDLRLRRQRKAVRDRGYACSAYDSSE